MPQNNSINPFSPSIIRRVYVILSLVVRYGNRTFRTLDVSHHGRFAPAWAIRTMGISPLGVSHPPGRFAPWAIRTLGVSHHGRFAPWAFRTRMDDSHPGRFAPWAFRTLGVSHPGRFAPFMINS